MGGGSYLVQTRQCVLASVYPPCKRIGNISCRIIPETDIDDHRVHVTVFPDSSTVRLVLQEIRHKCKFVKYAQTLPPQEGANVVFIGAGITSLCFFLSQVCTDIDECAEEPRPCAKESKCINLPVSFFQLGVECRVMQSCVDCFLRHVCACYLTGKFRMWRLPSWLHWRSTTLVLLPKLL